MAHLWLCPARARNLQATVLNPLPFERLATLAAIEPDMPGRIRERYPADAQGVCCWALRGDPRSRTFFNRDLTRGSVCLFTIRGTGRFDYAVRLVGKLAPCGCNHRPANGNCCNRRYQTIQFARELWPEDANDPRPWELLFFTGPAKEVTIPKIPLFIALGWSPALTLQYNRPVIEQAEALLLQRIGSIEQLWHDIEAHQPLEYLFANHE
jgi:hypothetical protein